MAKSGLTHEDVTQILRLIDGLPDGDVEIEKDDFQLRIKKGESGISKTSPRPARVSQEAPASEAHSLSDAIAVQPNAAHETASPLTAASPVLEEGLIAVRAPMLGRFYRAQSPNDGAFVEIGTSVGPEDTVGIIEVMKLFSTIKASTSGTVVAINAENNSMVEFDQVLMMIRPD